MMRLPLLFVLFLAMPLTVLAAQSSYDVTPLAPRIFAAVAKPGGKATTNAFFVLGEKSVIAGGAHMTGDAIRDLWAAIAETTDKPVSTFILTHHHPGFSQIDTAFPADVTMILSGDTWQELEQEVRKPVAPILLFSDNLTLKQIGIPTIVLNNLGPAHTDGDTLVVFPDERIAYAGDLFYVRSVGYMGSGHMRSWLQALDILSGFDLKTIVPGYGAPAGKTELDEFRTYFRDFLSEVLVRKERGETAEILRKTFTLPRYEHWAGYRQFIRENARRALENLSEDLDRN